VADVLERLKVALADRYRIERELGSGGMATVYLAHDLKHERLVAVKVLRPELAASLGADRFLREIKITANLNHPHILPLLDSGEADSFLYYVMPYVEGESLRDRLKRERQLPLEDALKITGEVADALGSAHRHNVIHRDIKPENILLEEGHAVVADFGVARAISAAGGEQLTETGIAVGTPVYMSPEQASGEVELDSRSDIYSLGCVLYEMLGGEPPHTGPTPQAILARKCVEPVPDLRHVREAVPRTVERVMMQALSSMACDRYATAAEFADALDQAYAEAVAPLPLSGWRILYRSRAGLVLVVLLVAVIGASAWIFVRSARARWAADEAMPEIQRLMDDHEFVAAYRLAQQAEPYLAQNPEFQRLWRDATLPVSIHTEPPGAEVRMTDYRTPDGEWDLLGTSPIDETRIPTGYLRFRVEKEGFQTIEGALAGFLGQIEFVLDSENERPEMIRVPGRPFQFRSLPAVRLETHWLDRYEVTNRAFREFVEQGGYAERRFWTYPIIVDGRVVPWEQQVTAFMDRTGRLGPSTWELGTYPDGAGDLPVSGVSWYEAAAYCEYVGKQLPTIYHWYNAGGLGTFSSILKLSNLSGQEPAPVGTRRGIGPYGHYDMAGNVREWVLNPVGDRRYVLGGAWSDPGYMFSFPDAASPEDRSPKNGFRCASYAEESAGVLGAELEFYPTEYERKPIDDAAFRLYRSLYSYEPTPLNAKVESVNEDLPHWRRETVTFDAPYGRDTVIAHLYLPKTGNPPYQAVVFYPGMHAFRIESSRDIDTKWFDFIVRTGRAVVHPVYEGMYERQAGLGPILEARHGTRGRELVVHWTMDISRSIDYLETRSDIDATRVAYYGFSWGAWNGPIFTAIETRFKASILLSGGIWEEYAPEIEPTNFAPRATVPVLMVNGRDDFIFPVEMAQRPLYRMLGAQDRDKQHAVLEGGHVPDDWQSVVTKVLDWLDRYLGPLR
jgi:predicted esterase